jgi:hypothetical protein
VRASAGLLAPYLPQLIADGRLLLLCDALNEMPRESADGRDLLAEVIEYLDDQPHFVVSCRFNDYKNDLAALHPLEQVRLRDLELLAVREFIGNYLLKTQAEALWEAMGGGKPLETFWRQVNEKGEGERFWDATAGIPMYTSSDGDRAWRHMHSGARLIPLCRKPYMGFLLTDLYRDSGEIPANRSALFGGFVTKLLTREQINAHKRGETFPDFDAIRDLLTEVANAMQRAKGTTLTDDALPAGIDPTLLNAAEAATILAYDGNNWTFTHQLLQEYFAARVLLAAMERGDDPADTISGDWWEPGVWRETAVILGEVADPNEVAAWLAPYSPELARIVISDNAEFQAGQVKLSSATRQLIVDAAWKKGKAVDPIERAAAYRVLGHPDIDADDRDGIGLDANGLPDIDWVPIPAGEFIYQDNERVTLPAFQMARYPVTYRQFQAFVEADDFEHPDWWRDMPEKYTGKQALRDQNNKHWNHPRDRVSWYQAVAFCRWLNDKTGEQVTLPHEWQWERAARGTDGLIYPYGKDFDAMKGNTRETGIGQTSAVGIFPQGASPYGMMDMSGNVWEWCLNKYDDLNNYSIDNSNSFRALRGGSYDLEARLARADYCGYDLPIDRLNLYGFRLVLSAPLLINSEL